MQQQASVTPATMPATATANKTESNRTVWIYTGYVAAALGLLGVLAYHFSGYLLK